MFSDRKISVIPILFISARAPAAKETPKRQIAMSPRLLLLQKDDNDDDDDDNGKRKQQSVRTSSSSPHPSHKCLINCSPLEIRRLLTCTNYGTLFQLKAKN